MSLSHEPSGASGAPEGSGHSGVLGRVYSKARQFGKRSSKRQGSGDDSSEGFDSPSRSNTVNTSGTHGRPSTSHSGKHPSALPESEAGRTTRPGSQLLYEEPAATNASAPTAPETSNTATPDTETRVHTSVTFEPISSESTTTTTRRFTPSHTISSHTETYSASEQRTSDFQNATTGAAQAHGAYHDQTPANSHPQTPVTPPSHPIDTPMTSPPLRASTRDPTSPASPRTPLHAGTYVHTELARSTYLSETDNVIRQYVFKLGDASLADIPKITGVESYLKHIGDERLRRLPQLGSDWDRIFHAAQFFGLQLWGLGCAVGDASVTDDISTGTLTRTQTLLLLGHLQTRTLLPTFQVFYQLGVKLAHTSRIHGTAQAKGDVLRLYRAVVALIDAVANFYRAKLTLQAQDGDKTIDFESSFGSGLDNIWACHRTIVAKIWLPNLGERNPEDSTRLELVYRHLRLEWSEREEFYERVTACLARAGNTCEWFRPHLADFLAGEQKALAITGGPGSGKTFLAQWIEEQLLVPLDYEDELYTTLTYAFPFDSHLECTQLSFLKSILFQLFEKRIGKIDVYTNLAHAFEEHSQRPNAPKLEESLWAALRSALKTPDHNEIRVVMVFDGIDRVTDEQGNPLPAFYASLLELTSKLRNSRLITLSNASSLGESNGNEFAIPSADLGADIEAYYRHAFSLLDCLSDHDRESIVQMLFKKPDTIPFLWASFMVQLLQFSKDTTREGILRTAKSIGGLSLDDTLKQLIPDQLLKDETTRRILSFMLVAQRTPTVAEASELVGIDIANLGNKVTIDLRDHVNSFCSDIVVIRHSALHFRSETIRNHVRSRLAMGGLQPAEINAHQELAAALLLYAKLVLEPIDITIPSFNLLDSQTASKLTSSYPLLQYAVTYWQSHLRRSGFDVGGDPGLLRKVFPQSYRFGLLQWASWRDRYSDSKLVEEFIFFLQVQEACLAKDDLFILQTLAILATIHEDKGKHFDAAEYYYTAACHVRRRSESGLRFFNAFVTTCAESFLRCTGSFDARTLDESARQDIATRQQEMIRLLIRISIFTYGPSSDHVWRWYGELAKLYIALQMFADAQALGKEYGELNNQLPGGDIRCSRLVRRIYDEVEEFKFDFAVDLAAPEATRSQYQSLLIGMRGSLGIMEVNREITFLLQVASSYEFRREWTQAEDVYISLWKRIQAEFDATSPPSSELQENKLRVGIQYAQFLHNRNLGQEAADILILLWDEHKRYSWHRKSIVTLFQTIAFLLRTLGRLEIAVSILTKIWESGIFDGDSSLEVTIQQITEEITRTTVDRELVTTVTTLETILKTRHDHKVFDEFFFGTTLTLANRYMRREEWSDAERVLKETLRATWGYILTTQETPELPENNVSWCVRVAVCLAEFYDRQGFIDEAERTWLRASHPCRAVSSIKQGEARELLGAITRFCHWQNYHQSILDAFYHKIFIEFRNYLGSSHVTVIKVLYDLAAYSERLGRRSDAYKYHIEIVTALNNGLDYCHPGAYPAAVKLVNYYRQRRLWEELQIICKLLWQAFIHHRHGITFAEDHGVTFTEDDVQAIYDGYISVLERQTSTNAFTTMYAISVEFRDTVKTAFASDAFIVVMAKFAVAAVCESFHRYVEAADAYEELIKTTTVTKATKQTITESKQRLSAVYVTIITSDSSIEVVASTIRRAIELCHEIYTELRAERGCWHRETLEKLYAVIILRQKLGDQESDIQTIELLRGAFRDVVITAESSCGSLSLYEAAKVLANCFIAANQQDLGLDLVAQVRQWSVFGRYTQAASGLMITFTPDTALNKRCYVFLVAFKQVVSKRGLSAYSELMAADRQERILYKKYKDALEKDKSTAGKDRVVLACGANLRAFWLEHEEKRMSDVLEDELFIFFKEVYSPFLNNSNDRHAHTFLLALLINLCGSDNYLKDVDFGAIVCQAGNAAVHDLLKTSQFEQVLEVARCAFNFADKQGFYKHQRHVPYAFNLAELMAGIDANKPPSGTLRTGYLDLSKHITVTAMRILREMNIDIIRLHLEDHKGIIRLLGYQRNYKDLQSHLYHLRTSPLANSNVPLTLSLIRLSIHADAAPSDFGSAINICRNITHNLQQSRGPLDHVTISFQEILSSLYSTKGSLHFSIKIHEDVLRQIESAAGGSKLHTHWDRMRRGPQTQGSTRLVDKKMLAETAGRNLKLLMYAYVRKGDWTRKKQTLDETYARLQKCLDNQVKPLLRDQVYRDGVISTGDQTGLYVPLRDEEWVIDGEGLAGADYVEAAGMIWGWICEIGGRGMVG